ncbi:MAG: YceI family protein [Alphaproteobacteria bacterium]|nr:YceI family protein [Alphaproteobacteria bacterium]
MSKFWFAVIALMVAVPASAAPPQWNVVPTKSSLRFAVAIEGQTVVGKFKAFGALIAFDPADLAHSSAKITLPMDEAKTEHATRDAMLLKPDWFNILDFPQAVFQTASFVAKGGNKYEAVGTLKLKGVTKAITLPFTLDIKGDTAVVKGETVLRRLDFGVGQGPDFADATRVSLGVRVLVNVTARRAK